MDNSDVISICSMVVAIAALGTALWQGYIARKHSKLSVIPRLVLDFYSYPGLPVKVELHNKGIGPAVIDDFQFELDERKFKIEDIQSVEGVIERLGLNPKEIARLGHFPSKGATLLPGDTHRLIEFTNSHENLDFHSKLTQLLPRIGFAIRYRNVYGDMFDIDVDH